MELVQMEVNVTVMMVGLEITVRSRVFMEYLRTVSVSVIAATLESVAI